MMRMASASRRNRVIADDAAFTVRPARAGVHELSGALSFTNARAALQELREILRKASGEVVLDLQGVTRVDSAGLALLIEVIRLAQQGPCVVRFRNLPAQLETLAAVSGVVALFGSAQPLAGAPSQS